MGKFYSFISAFLCVTFFYPANSFAEQEERKKEIREESSKKLRIIESEKRVEISAILNRRYYRKPSTFAVSYNGGFSAKRALFIAKTSPQEVYEALKKIGAIPAIRSSKESIKDESGPSNLRITLYWKGVEKEYGLEEILSNSQGKNFDFIFLGNIDSAEQFESGELICLDSCQTGITGVPDIEDKAYDKGEILFTVNEALLPVNGTEIKIIFSMN